MGRYLEEIVLGQTYRTRGRTVGEGDISTFAGLVGDFTPLHTDEHYARSTRYGGRIAHGPLIMSIAVGLMSQLDLLTDTLVALLNLQWDFKAPVRIGDTVYANVTATDKRLTSRGDTGVVTLRLDVINHEQQIVQVGTMKVLLRARS